MRAQVIRAKITVATERPTAMYLIILPTRAVRITVSSLLVANL